MSEAPNYRMALAQRYAGSLLAASAIQPTYPVVDVESGIDAVAPVSGAWSRFSELREARSDATQSAVRNTRRNERLSPSDNTEEAMVFNRLVDLKVSAASIAMHLKQEWREGLFEQLDNLIDRDNWDFEDALPTLKSFLSFLRLMDVLKLPKRPGLAATADGNVIATWTEGVNRLTIECLPADSLRIVTSREHPDGLIRQATLCKSVQAPAVLDQWKPEIWFDDD